MNQETEEYHIETVTLKTAHPKSERGRAAEGAVAGEKLHQRAWDARARDARGGWGPPASAPPRASRGPARSPGLRPRRPQNRCVRMAPRARSASSTATACVRSRWKTPPGGEPLQPPLPAPGERERIRGGSRRCERKASAWERRSAAEVPRRVPVWTRVATAFSPLGRR